MIEIATTPNKLTVPTEHSIEIIHFQSIKYLQSESNYTHFHLINDKPICVSKTLKYYSSMLPEHDFVRIHRSYYVAIEQIRRVVFRMSSSVTLTDGTQLPVSRKGKQILKKIFNF